MGAMVETEMLKPTSKIDEKKRATFVAREIATLKRWRAKGQAGARRFKDYANWSDADIVECAEAQARIYSDQFIVYERVA